MPMAMTAFVAVIPALVRTVVGSMAMLIGNRPPVVGVVWTMHHMHRLRLTGDHGSSNRTEYGTKDGPFNRLMMR